MSQTQFCYSTAISELNQARERAEAGGGQLRLATTTASVLGILPVTGIGELFPIFTSLPGALAGGPGHPRHQGSRRHPDYPGP